MKTFKSLSALALVIYLIPSVALCADISLKWDANSEADLAGYRIFYRPFNGTFDYKTPIWEGTQTTCTVTVPGDGAFVARAFDQAGNESVDSNVVTLDMPPTAPNNFLIDAINNLASAVNRLAGALAGR